jgi:hypothetical protein
MTRITLAAIAAMLASSAHAASCLPKQFSGAGSVAVTGENPKGCWAGWRCPNGKLVLLVAVKSVCDSASGRKTLSGWLNNPEANALTFGLDPFATPALRAVWEPERSKLDALRVE